MDLTRFIFWSVMKTLGLAFLALLAAKAASGLIPGAGHPVGRSLRRLKVSLHAVALALVALGAYTIGIDIAAEIYCRASRKNLTQGQIGKAYINASRAVQLRPAVLGYWQVLEDTKLRHGQFRPLLADRKILESLNGGKLAEGDAYRIALGYYYLGLYEQSIPLTQLLIRENRLYAPPYVLQGHAYTAQGKYAEAQQAYLAVLQLFPTHEGAVKGLAHARFLSGDKVGALRTLDETAKFPFPPEARQRFEALKGFYDQ